MSASTDGEGECKVPGKACQVFRDIRQWTIKHRNHCRNAYRGKNPDGIYALANKGGYIKYTYFTDEQTMKKELEACNGDGKRQISSPK